MTAKSTPKMVTKGIKMADLKLFKMAAKPLIPLILNLPEKSVVIFYNGKPTNVHSQKRLLQY